VFKARPGPEGLTASLFELKECPMPVVGPGQALVATYLLSLDPTIRNALAGPQVSDHPQAGRSMYYQVMNWEPGTVPTWTSVGYVVESQNPGLPVGACVKVTAPWQRYVSVSEAEVLEIDDTVRPENYLSVLGLTGLTAMLPITKYAQANLGSALEHCYRCL
jgi:NADPH-dependent curcumin reductase CurA